MLGRQIDQQGISRLWLVAAVAVLLLVLLSAPKLFGHKGSVSRAQDQPSLAAAQPAYDTRLSSPNKRFDLAVQNGRLVSGPSHMTVQLGDSVRVNLKALGTAEIKAALPAYGITTESAPEDDPPGGFSFIADKAGTFPFYLIANAGSGAVQTPPLGTITVEK